MIVMRAATDPEALKAGAEARHKAVCIIDSKGHDNAGRSYGHQPGSRSHDCVWAVVKTVDFYNASASLHFTLTVAPT
jgi:hypothetical protein